MSEKKVAAAALIKAIKLLITLDPESLQYEECLDEIAFHAREAGLKYTNDHSALRRAAELIVSGDDNDGGGAPGIKMTI